MHKIKFHHFIYFLFILFFILSCLISFSRYNSGQIFYYDFGIFAHTIFQLSRFQLAHINHLVLGNVVFLADHFNPALVLFAPLFWITSDLRILLVEQAAAVTLSGFMVYKIAEARNWKPLAAILISGVYLVFAGTLNPLVTDWHPESTAALMLLSFYFFFVEKKSKKYIIPLLIFIFLKESNALSLVFLLSWIGIEDKSLRKPAIIISVLSVIYFLLVTQVIIPSFGHAYLYKPTLPTNPVNLVTNIVSTSEKRTLINQAFISFAYLPVFSGVGIIVPLAELSIRLMPDSTVFNNLTLGQHYNVLLGVALILTSIYGVENIIKLYNRLKKSDNPNILTIVCALSLIIALFIGRRFTNSPINFVSNPLFYKQYSGDPVIQEIINKVPKNGIVMSQNNLLAYFVNRTDKVFYLEEGYASRNASIIVIDNRDGKSENNFYGTTVKNRKEFIEKLKKDGEYKLREMSEENVYIFEKVNKKK